MNLSLLGQLQILVRKVGAGALTQSPLSLQVEVPVPPLSSQGSSTDPEGSDTVYPCVVQFDSTIFC